jgi:hypothetical protein
VDALASQFRPQEWSKSKDQIEVGSEGTRLRTDSTSSNYIYLVLIRVSRVPSKSKSWSQWAVSYVLVQIRSLGIWYDSRLRRLDCYNLGTALKYYKVPFRVSRIFPRRSRTYTAEPRPYSYQSPNLKKWRPCVTTSFGHQLERVKVVGIMVTPVGVEELFGTCHA